LGGGGVVATETHPLPNPPLVGEGAQQVPGSGIGSSDKRIWTLFTITLFVPAVLGFLWLLRGALRTSAFAGRDFTLGQRLLTEPRVLVDYLHWTLFPNPEVLSLYHDEIVVSTGLLTPWTTLGAMVSLAALIVIALWLRKRRPLVALGIGWFFAAQLLTATIIPLELVYEQRMYFASIGVLMAAGALLLGFRWRIRLPLLRGFVVTIAVLWFAVATNLRAREWSNPLRLAIAEANRHPESGRAVYEAGRLLLIASNYEPGKTLDASWKYLHEAAAIPGSSALADQAMIMIADHGHQGDDAAYWDSMAHKLRDQPTRQEDISALISLTNCYGASTCKFDVANLQRAYEAALSRPHPIARLNGAYAAFQRDIMHNDQQAIVYLEDAVAGAPGESAYRVDLAALYARQGETEKALQQIDALRRMNLAGRLDGQIATLERLAEKGTGGN
jgi:tetratricopeptide (TPR) repeat protein